MRTNNPSAMANTKVMTMRSFRLAVFGFAATLLHPNEKMKFGPVSYRLTQHFVSVLLHFLGHTRYRTGMVNDHFKNFTRGHRVHFLNRVNGRIWAAFSA